MDIKDVLKEFVKTCSNKLNLYSILQFGSSTHSKNFDDVDLMFVFNERIFSAKDLLSLRKIILNFEKKYPEVLFDFGGVGTRKKKAKYEITVVLMDLKGLKIEHSPHDLFFFKTLSGDKNKKILFGSDPFEDFEFQLTNQHLFEIFSSEVRLCLRNYLDDDEKPKKYFYRAFKTFFRGMLINKGHFKKSELLDKFKDKFGKEIKLPKNSKRIIKNQIKKEDFKDILKFFEDCLKYLIK